MSDKFDTEETFHLGGDDKPEEEESFHLSGDDKSEVEESFRLGGDDKPEMEESFHLGGDDKPEVEESFHIGGDTEEVFSLGGSSNDNGTLGADEEDILDYTISEDGNSIIINAVDEALDVVQDYIRDKLVAYGCANKAIMQIRLAVEEIFVNIISYAYRPEIGKAEVFCEVTEAPLAVCIQFMDSGKPFDPLAKADIDDSEELFIEQEGGFGIHLVKNTMDAVDYSYEDGKNILTIRKLFDKE